MSGPRVLEASWLGRVAYAQGLRLQELRVEEVREGRAPEALFLLEHDAVITLGRNAHREHVVASPQSLAAMGIGLAECGRGGDVTYHGPGQLVGYPILDLAPGQKDVWKYVRGLEEAVIRTLAEYAIPADRIQGLTGVWVKGRKVAAIGVRVARWVTSHGFALNIATNMDHFATIIPCGIRNHGVTSMAELLDAPPPLREVAERFAPHFAEIFGRELAWVSGPGLAPAGCEGGEKRK